MSEYVHQVAQRRAAEAARQHLRTELAMLGSDWGSFFEEFLDISVNDHQIIEDFRTEYCPTCRSTDGESDLGRSAICSSRRCWMCDADRFEREQHWTAQMIARLLPTILASPNEVQSFNDHVARTGCLTPTIDRTETGSYIRGYRADTLRGQIQLGLLLAVFYSAGDLLHLHVADNTGLEARDKHLRARECFKAYQQDLAARLRFKEGKKATDIARMFGITPETLNVWIEESDKRHATNPASDVARWLHTGQNHEYPHSNNRITETITEQPLR